MQPGDSGWIGFLGVGTMGSGIVANLLQAGFKIKAFDLDAARLDAAAAQGAQRGVSAREVVDQCDHVLCSLRSSDVFVHVADETLIPCARAGQVFVDFGTTTVPQTRRIAQQLRAKGAELLDTPVSGSPRAAGFRVFIGGDAETARRCRPLFEAQTEPKYAVYCGPSGAGQIVKGVNQLGMGLVNAAYMEAVAFGVAGGVDPAVIEAVVGGESGFRREIAHVARQAAEGKAENLDNKFPELHYFLEQAQADGYEIPMTRALLEFSDPGPRNWRDNMNRPCVSYWHQLMQARKGAQGGA